jgi:hypothetical protein
MRTNSYQQSSRMAASNSQVILEVVTAIGTHEMSELLAALNEMLKPIVHFDAISIVILEGRW